MKFHLVVVTIAMLASSVKCIQLLSNYNLVSPSHFSPQVYNNHAGSPGIVQALGQRQDLAHPAVVQNSIAEAQLPPELLNPFYKNPVIASALARESWFGHKEFPVHHREAERIQREEIYKIVSRLRN